MIKSFAYGMSVNEVVDYYNITVSDAEDFYCVSENTRDFSHGMNRLHMLLKYSKQILINT
jgi:hypothetical protein